jgi:diguanylate cyclase (GGDEF)-like protein
MSFTYWAQQMSVEKMKADGVKDHVNVIKGVVGRSTTEYLTSIFGSITKDMTISNKGIDSSLAQLDVFNNMSIVLDSAIIFEKVVYQKRAPEKKLSKNFIFNETAIDRLYIYNTSDALHYVQPFNNGKHALYLILDKAIVDNSVKNPNLTTSLNNLLSFEIDHNLIYLIFGVGIVFVLFMLAELQAATTFVITKYGELSLTKNDSLKDALPFKKLVKSNVDQINKRIDELSIVAFRDELTKLGNRNALRKDIAGLENKSQREPATLMHIRLLELLSFRDQYGGNAMRNAIYAATLKVKEVLDSHRKKADLRLYRVCDDELGLLMNSKDRMIIDAVIKDLLTALSKKILIESVSAKIELNVAVGVSIYPSHDKNLGNLVNTAELSMQRASEDLENNVVFFNELPQSKFKKLKIRSIDNVIESALESAEFYLLYQPIFSHEKGVNSIIGFEALLRSENSILTQFNIPEIIGAAEHGDVMAMLGRFVLSEATEQLKHWQEIKLIDPDVFISVNISTYQFFNDSLESLVMDTIRKVGLKPSNLRLEFKQDIYLSHNKVLRSSIKEVREQGVGVYLDDFDVKGLSYALQVNNTVDGIKIDRKWLADAQKKKSFDLITSMINMGKYLNIKIGISGVEDAADIPKLSDMGCSEIQGYAYSKPEKADFIEKQLTIMAKI